jgi:hypothetical protein
MGEMDADTIGQIVLAAVLMIFFVAVQRQQPARRTPLPDDTRRALPLGSPTGTANSGWV